MPDSQRVCPRGELLSSVHLVGSLMLMKMGALAGRLLEGQV